jgi:hypothetical protein
MSNKKTVSIPTNVGSHILTAAFGRINLSNDVKENLSALDAELSIRYNPDNEKPTVSVVKKDGSKFCSLEEFKSLSGFRRFVNVALKGAERVSSTNENLSSSTSRMVPSTV